MKEKRKMTEKPKAFGIELDGKFPEGWTPFEIVVLAKCMDESGVTRLCYQSSRGWNQWELLGAFRGFADNLSLELHHNISDTPYDDDST
jgi:hypothetical protein